MFLDCSGTKVADLLHTKVCVNPPGDSFRAVDDDPYAIEPLGGLPPNINFSSVFATSATANTRSSKKKKQENISGSEILQSQTKHSVLW